MPRRIIDNKQYDTKTAKLIATCEKQYSDSNMNYVEILFKKRTGEYFIYGKGGYKSLYTNKYYSNDDSNCWDIVPVSIKKAQTWLIENCLNDEYNQEFGDDDDSEVAVCITLPKSTKEKCRRMAAKQGISAGMYIANLIEGHYKDATSIDQNDISEVGKIFSDYIDLFGTSSDMPLSNSKYSLYEWSIENKDTILKLCSEINDFYDAMGQYINGKCQKIYKKLLNSYGNEMQRTMFILSKTAGELAMNTFSQIEKKEKNLTGELSIVVEAFCSKNKASLDEYIKANIVANERKPNKQKVNKREDIVRNEIDYQIKKSSSLEDFFELMREQKYKIGEDHGKYYYIYPKCKTVCYFDSLGSNYTIEAILLRISNQESKQFTYKDGADFLGEQLS